ncbi:MAG: hypothetical protein SFU27_02820 [Thermonemataceae bacterium]|nr:hypothetical protein [Thermonemataceae bacterium]
MNFKDIHTKLQKIWVLMVLFLQIACSQKQPKDNSKKIAQMGDNTLYFSEIAAVIPSKIGSEDSLSFIENYRENWIRKQILYKKALKDTKIDEKEIQKRLDEYKYALITHEFEKQYISKNFSDKISEQEIKTFYENNIKEFELKQNIVKAIFIKIDGNSKTKSNIIRLMGSEQKKDRDELLQLCAEKAISYYLQDTTWVDFDELTKQTPLESIPNKISFLKNNKFSESNEAGFSYLIYIKEYKISEQNSPLEFVKERIKAMILNQRKALLIKKLEDELYKEAKKNKEFQIF